MKTKLIYKRSSTGRSIIAGRVVLYPIVGILNFRGDFDRRDDDDQEGLEGDEPSESHGKPRDRTGH